tara:strand:+ start:243 stop:464 length:222 start_codon:yes stop_codon:yes gene_type:complete
MKKLVIAELNLLIQRMSCAIPSIDYALSRLSYLNLRISKMWGITGNDYQWSEKATIVTEQYTHVIFKKNKRIK